MNRRRRLLIVALASLLACGAARAQDTNNSPGVDLKSFDVLATRNIFDPSRRGPRRPAPPPPRIDAFTLVGTMSYEKGRFAFFDGTSSEFRKTLKPSDKIAGYKIADIANDGIKLAASSNQTISLPVGTQMRRVNGGHWTFAGHAEPVPDNSTASAAAPASNSSTETSPALTGAESDVMKRLMLKRLQEK